MADEDKSVTILIGNSDNKLTQEEWFEFCSRINTHCIGQHPEINIHFSGPSIGWMRWQNACWVLSVPQPLIEQLKHRVSEAGKEFKQDSVGFIVGDIEFV